MQLNSGEHSILAYFADNIAAETAVQKLLEAGYSDVQLDPITSYNRSLKNSLSSKVYPGGTAEYYRNYGPLLAADPIVSGMSSQQESDKYSYIVTVLTDNPGTSLASNILKSYGAMI